MSGRWIRTTNLHHLSSYKGGALPVKLFPVISQSTPSFSFNSWKSLSNSSTINFISFRMSHISFKNLIHPIVQHIVILNTQIQANCQNNRCYHIFTFLISIHKIVSSTMRTQVRRPDVRVERVHWF